MTTNPPATPRIAMMLDIETLSLRPDAYVTQCGVVVANLDTREILFGPQNYWLSEDGQQNRHRDIGTIKWWMAQKPEAQQAVFTPPSGSPVIPATTLFDNLKTLVDQHPGVTVWASPAMYDLPILTSLFGGNKPWVYNMERDMMTLYKYLDPEKKLQPAENPLAHDAASDAMWQMQYLFNLHAPRP